MSETPPRTIAVLGLGYVGCVTAACLARIGHRVIGVDTDPHKVASVQGKRSPFYEPNLQSIVEETVSAGRLTATGSLHSALASASVALVCVGTPSEAGGNIGLTQLRRVAEEIASALPGRHGPLTVVIRSTVFPGTCEEIVLPVLGESPLAPVVCNPEFLREGSAVQDFMEPSLLVVGGDNPVPVDEVAALYAALPVEPCRVSLRSAEMIKYACNSFHAVKIAFANEIGALSNRLGLSGDEVMQTLCRDRKLNISPAYLKPGFAFGGSCLPKDLRALNYRASRLDLKLPLLESILPANDQHLRRAIDAAVRLPVSRIGVYGLAFKEDTDDLRESPIVSLIEYLIGKGRELRIFDPNIRLEEIYGTNRRFILEAIPHIGKLLDRDLADTLAASEYLIVARNPSTACQDRISRSAIPVLDLTRT